MNDAARPDPEKILEALNLQSRLDNRGRLKIFFGACPGVGKTYAMLLAARAEQSDGVDVLAGVIETHKRIETERLLEGFKILPRRSIAHGNVLISEFDLDTALKIRPRLILVDELAHTNATGSRHPKRWQDVEELLNAGIDVFTTLNVQHLEGLNDTVSNITGVYVRETVPEKLFDEANDIQLVDIPTEELLERLRDGKVYIAEGAKERAAQNFFNKTNLMSLRELALRRTAEHVDADTDYERVQSGLFTPNIAGDRVLVCLGQDDLSMKLVRTARKVANSLKAPWYALGIEAMSEAKSDIGYQKQQRALNAAERNGAIKIASIQEDKIGDAILNYAKNNGITKIVIGRNIRPAWMDWLFGSLVEYIIRHSGIMDIYVITAHGRKQRTSRNFKSETAWNYLWAVLTLAACTGFGVVLRDVFKPIDVIMIYLIGVIMCAVKFGRFPSFLFALLSVGTLNFFFIEPIYTFTMVDGTYWLSLAVMLIASFVISEQATGLRKQTLLSKARESRTQVFYDLTKELAANRSGETVIATTLEHLKTALSLPVAFSQVDPDGVSQVYGEIKGDDLKEETVIIWAFQNGQPAGAGTNTMPSATGYYFPIMGQHGYGVMGVYGNNELTVDEKVIIETFARLLTTALDRVTASSNAEKLKVDREAERLKNTFLSSMSHDMRTPLSAIRGSAETLLNNMGSIDAQTQRRLLRSIGDESERLFRLVKNLLDLTKFETGNITLKRQPYYLQEIIGSVLKNLEVLLAGFDVTVNVQPSLPMVNVDGLLVEQVFQNLLENAASFSVPGSRIQIDVSCAGDLIEVEVSDEGAGIPEGSEKSIFDKFFTLSQGDRPKGAGLGLAICQAIVTAHGGEIKGTNRAEDGSCFSFTLPVFKNEMP